MGYLDIPKGGSGVNSYNSIADFPNATGSGDLAWDETAQTLYIDDPLTAAYVVLSAPTGGEANTGLNYGNAGVGPYDSKSGVALRFRNITSADAYIGVTLDNTNHNVVLTLDKDEVTGGYATDKVVGTDSTGVLDTIDNWSRNSLGGVERQISVSQGDQGGNQVLIREASDIEVTANTTDGYYQIANNMTVNGSFDMGNLIQQELYQFYNGTGTIGDVYASNIVQYLGDGIGASESVDVRNINASLTINEQHKLSRAYALNSYIESKPNSEAIDLLSLNMYMNVDGLVTGNIFGFAFSPNINASSSVAGLIGATLNPQINSTVANYNGLQVGGYGTSAPTNFTGVQITPDFTGTVTNFTGVSVSGGGNGEKDNYTGYNVYTDADGSSFTGFNLGANISGLSNYFNGININPNIGSVPNATGLYINMSSVTSPNKKAIDVTGDVNINGNLSFSGALAIGALNAYATQAITSGSGNPVSIHSLISAPTFAANTTITLADTLGVNTAALMQFGDNATVTTGLTGVVALGLPAVVTMGVGSTVDIVSGALFAISLDAAATGGTIDVVALCRSLALPNAATTVTNLRGFQFDLPFGDVGTNIWGFYASPDCFNWMKGSLKIGGTAGSTDRVSAANVGLELAPQKAFILGSFTTTERNALMASDGMVVFNSTTSKAQCYAGGIWNDLF